MDRSSKSSSFRPVVSVYLGNKSIPLNRMNNYVRLIKLVEANKEANTILNFFTAEDVDFTERRINGTYFNYSSKTWQKKEFGLPDVVYVRGGGEEIEKLLAAFDSWGVKRLNPIPAFNKGELFELLSQDHNVSRFLPPTVSVESMNDIRSAIQRLGTVYVKARRGRKGTQVMRIERLAKKGYLYSYSVLGKLVRRKVASMNGVEKAIVNFFSDKKVIVQRAINLVRVNKNRLVDFRAEVQRNKKGDIDIVGICVRIGRQNAPITTHATAYRYDTYLKKLFPHYSNQQIRALINKIKAFLITVYFGVEKKYGQFGEMGIDFAVDRKGDIWLIECNAQSAKVSIVKAYGSKANRVFLNPLQYAKVIANLDRGTDRQHNNRSQSKSNRSQSNNNRSQSNNNRSQSNNNRSLFNYYKRHFVRDRTRSEHEMSHTNHNAYFGGW
ncbi:hypothetical protein SD71_04145 [Cohnella kolymensis]|uniref:ATP-grasp domain-containing protein n=1 Tax=Cohnella kolymensis TaxID=1590652 RepID=A0ABR5A7I4_9BACL|nr:YheC/YheD family protein [Cohnella kolymensis]KIL36920.1 hypothetical protein SD71_04145 [Cohnella kolymensis]